MSRGAHGPRPDPRGRAGDERAPPTVAPAPGDVRNPATVAPVLGGDRSRRAAAWRLGGFAALALAEVTFFFARFDTVALGADPQGWRRYASRAYVLSYLVLAVLTALAFVGRRAWPALGAAGLDRLRSARAAAPFLAAQVLAFGALAWVSAQLFDPPVPEASRVAGWLAAWVACGALAAGLWLLVLYPIGALRGLLRRVARPLVSALVVGVAAWIAGLLTPSLWDWWKPLSRATLWVAYALLAPFTDAIAVYPDELCIGSEQFTVEVVEYCSGYQGIGLIWVFIGAYLWLFRDTLRFPRAWLVLLFSTVLVWLANAVRIAALVAIGTWIDGDIASGGFHSKAGWVLFCGVALGTVAVTRRLPYFARDGGGRAAGGHSRATAAYLLPLLVLIATAMVTGAFSTGLDPLYGLRVVAALAVLALYRREYAELRPAWGASAPLLGLAVAALWIALVPTDDGGARRALVEEHLAGASALGLAAWWGARVVGFVVVAPLVEELAFRGYLMRRLLASDFTEVPPGRFSWRGLVVSSLAFGLLHQHALLAGVLAGLLFAAALHLRGRLFDAVLAHAVANALLALYAALTGRWGVWI